MSDFKWSPEAIEAADIAVSEGVSVGDVNLGRDAIYAAVKVQPVVALPPCSTCKGWGSEPNDAGRPGIYIGKNDPPCPVCKGSGVERLVPVAKAADWLFAHKAGAQLVKDFEQEFS